MAITLFSKNILIKFSHIDTFVEDFLMTHIIFLPVVKLCPILMQYYEMLDNSRDSILAEVSINNKRKVLFFK